MEDFTPEANPASFDSRFTVCEKCGSPVQASVEGGDFACPCGTSCHVGPRDVTPIGSASPRPVLMTQERLARLGLQDGHPWLPPESVAVLVKGGRIPEWKWQEALIVWQQARKELASTSSPDAAERLLFLTVVIGNGFVDKQDWTGLRAFTEAAFDALSLPRHRQYMCAQLARLAVRRGDTRSAERWIALLDTESDDLDTDSAYRSARAFVDTASADYRRVLETLGRAAGEVPIADSLDNICDVLRANALERTGNAQAAVDALVVAMSKGRADVTGITHILEGFPALRLCTRSFPDAKARVDEAAASRAASSSGGSISRIFLLVGAVEMLAGLGLAAAAAVHHLGLMSIFEIPPGEGGILAPAGAGIFMVLMGAGFIVAGRRAHRRAQKARRLRLEGIEAEGRVVSVRFTGTKINSVPQFEITVSVSLPGKPPYEASSKVLLPQHAASALTPGTVIHIRVDPQNPMEILVETL